MTEPDPAASGAPAAPPPPTPPPPPPTPTPTPVPTPSASRPAPTFSGYPPPVAAAQRPGPPAAEPARRPRRATLTVARIDPWSALKVSAGFSAAGVVVIIVAVMALDALLSAMGVFSSVDAVLSKTSPGLHIGYPVVDVFLVALLIGLLDVVILTAIGTLAAFLYNLVGDLVGGLEVTLAERD